MSFVFLIHEVMVNLQGGGGAEEVPVSKADLLTVDSFSYGVIKHGVLEMSIHFR